MFKLDRFAMIAGGIVMGTATAFAVPATGGHLSPTDRAFVKKAAQGGMGEVALGQLAADRASRPEVKAFGQRMVTDHGKANDDLKSVASSEGFMLPSEPGPAQKQELARLSRLHGAAFDSAYVATMVKDHKMDDAGFSKEAAMGKDPGVRQFASQTLPVIQSHLDMIQGIAHHKHPTM